MTEKTSNFRIGVTHGMSGYFAVMLVDVTDESKTYTDVQNTGMGRYVTFNAAKIEAKEWAKAEGIPYIGDDL